MGDPPRNLSAYPVIGQATLNWDAPTSGTPTGYRIQQRVSWGEWNNLVDDTTTGREYVDTSIEHNLPHPRHLLQWDQWAQQRRQVQESQERGAAFVVRGLQPALPQPPDSS